MPEYNLSASTTTNMNNQNNSFSVNHESLDAPEQGKETWYDYPKASEYLGYYKNIPELKKAIDMLATWVLAQGYESKPFYQAIANNFIGWGEDSFNSIMWNLLVQKKVYGDAFAEVIREENEGEIINIKPLDPSMMRVVVDQKGMIIRYEQRNRHNKTAKKFKPSEILHLVNDRVGDEIHGTSVIEACKWIIDARNEAMQTHRKVLNRNLALGILYVDSEKDSKIQQVQQRYETAIKNGEVLVLPKGAAEIKDGQVRIENPLEWIRYLENSFYQAVGIPRVIATSEGFTEAGAKVGFLTFEPVYTREQTELEADLWSQLAIKIKFNRPPSLSGMMSEEEQKNQGQIGIQPSDTKATVTRNE